MLVVLGAVVLTGGCLAKSRPRLDGGGGIVAKGEGAMVRVAWQMDDQSGVLGFNVLRGLNDAGPWELVNPEPIPVDGDGEGAGSYSYFDVGLVEGETRCYWVEAVGEEGTREQVTAVMCGVAMPRPHFVEAGYLPAEP
jgi:hypothetical protein